VTGKLTDTLDEAGTSVEVEHHPERKRFEARLDGKTAFLEYLHVRETLILSHSEVPRGLEGRGVGSALVKTALEYVRDHELTAAPLCPFARAYIHRHPEYKVLVGFGQRGEGLR
jgi:predicted GNAT family acetyltransferase